MKIFDRPARTHPRPGGPSCESTTRRIHHRVGAGERSGVRAALAQGSEPPLLLVAASAFRQRGDEHVGAAEVGVDADATPAELLGDDRLGQRRRHATNSVLGGNGKRQQADFERGFQHVEWLASVLIVPRPRSAESCLRRNRGPRPAPHVVVGQIAGTDEMHARIQSDGRPTVNQELVNMVDCIAGLPDRNGQPS